MKRSDSIRVYVLDGGHIEILDWALFQPDAGPGVRRSLANPCYLVVHPRGSLLWDTGLGDAVAAEPGGRRIGDIAVFHVNAPLADQLDEIGLSPTDLTYLALSHLHVDHVGNVDLFPANTLLVQHDEYEAAFGPDPAAAGLDPASHPSLRGNPVVKLAGDHDVFGDGTVVIKRFPGHTPGGQSLLVRLRDTGTVLISGDLAHSLDNWSKQVVPALNVDSKQTAESLRAAAELVARERATVWVQHEASQYETLRHAPAYYE